MSITELGLVLHGRAPGVKEGSFKVLNILTGDSKCKLKGLISDSYNIETLGRNVSRKCESNVSVLDSTRDTASAVSLDSVFLKGPDLVESLLSMMGKYVMKVNIRDMFLRIEVRESDREALRFFWRANEVNCC